MQCSDSLSSCSRSGTRVDVRTNACSGVPAAAPQGVSDSAADWGCQARCGLLGRSGFTLIELVLVIVLIGLVSTIAAVRFDSVFLWKAEAELRKFADTWQFLFNEAYGRGESYRLYINLDDNYYLVRREVPLEGQAIKQVDYLANLRTRSEKERRARKQEEEELRTIEEELAEEDVRQSGALDELFYQTLFSDPHSPKRLAIPVEFPALAQRRPLPQGLRFVDVVVRGERIETGRVAIALSPRAAAEYAAVHLVADDQLYTVVINPATGRVQVLSGDAGDPQDFFWQLENNE